MPGTVRDSGPAGPSEVDLHERQYPRAHDRHSTEDLAFDRWVSLAESKTSDDENIALALTLTRIAESAYRSAREGHDRDS